tara:strand:+ start:525 stop:1022 length:498 start_codon:yes stop_codon:yes gene_type:complete
MLKLPVSDSQIERAKKISNPDKVFNQNKIGKRAYLTGALGEIVVGDFLGVTPHVYKSFNDVYDFDIDYRNIRIEVKSKLVNKKPQPFYDCSIFGYNTKQKCDQYWFVNILKDMSFAFILGYINKDDFYRNAEFCKAGTNRGNLVYKWDNWVIKAYDLSDPVLIRD